MNIRIPQLLVRAWDAFTDWGDVPAWVFKGTYRHNMVTIRRIDVIVALGFIGCVSWYAYTTGWQGAVLGGVMYLAVVAMALWLF